jgi:phage gp46-like protein
MSGQDVGFFDVGTNCPDLVIENGDLKPDNGLETASLISLFSDKRVSFDELPQGQNERRGWWADLVSEPEDDEIGSKLWTIDREKTLESTAIKLESILADAFEWLLEDGLAASVSVDSTVVDREEILGSVQILKPSGENIPLKFIWDGQRLKILE